MTAQKEIDLWLQHGRELKSESEQKAFLKEIREKLHAKTPEEQKENLIALKDAVFDLGKRVEEAVNKSEIKVYPSSCEEREFLKNLFSKMNIRFKLG